MNTKKCWLTIAEIIDALRLVPRLILIVYSIFIYYVSNWYMGIAEPTNQHMALVTAVVGIIPFIVQIYTNSGRSWAPKQTEHEAATDNTS